MTGFPAPASLARTVMVSAPPRERTLAIPRALAGGDLVLTVGIVSDRRFAYVSLDRTGALPGPSLAFAASDNIRVRIGQHTAALWVGATQFTLSPPEAEAVRDLLDAARFGYDIERDAL